MNKQEFVDELQNTLGSGYSKQETAKVMDAVFEVLKGGLQNEGDEIKVYGFGKFECYERPAHTARNPRTGAPVQVPARKGIRFKASKTLVS